MPASNQDTPRPPADAPANTTSNEPQASRLGFGHTNRQAGSRRNIVPLKQSASLGDNELSACTQQER